MRASAFPSGNVDETQGGDEFLGFDSGDMSCGEAEGSGGVVYCNEAWWRWD